MNIFLGVEGGDERSPEFVLIDETGSSFRARHREEAVPTISK